MMAMNQMEELHDRWVDERDARIDIEVCGRDYRRLPSID